MQPLVNSNIPFMNVAVDCGKCIKTNLSANAIIILKIITQPQTTVVVFMVVSKIFEMFVVAFFVAVHGAVRGLGRIIPTAAAEIMWINHI